MKRREFISLLGAAAVTRTVAARAKQRALPVVAFVHPASAQRNEEFVAAFRQGLHDTGYIESRNVAIEFYWAEDRSDRLPALVDDLLSQEPRVIFATGSNAVLTVARATMIIPVVFNFASDPVELGLVASLSHPGGNITGITSLSSELAPKQMELLHKLVPTASTIALLGNPTNPTLLEALSRDVMAAARQRGLELRIVHASTEDQLARAFASLARLRADGLVIGPDTFFNGRSGQIAALALRHLVPAIYQFSQFPAAGGLMSYGTDHRDPYHDGGIYAGKILSGIKPSDIPIKQSTKFQLVINNKTAKALGLTIPAMLLARADEVIE